MTQLAESSGIDLEPGEAVHEPAIEVVEASSGFTPGDGHLSYMASRKARLRRRRLAALIVCIPIWVLSVVPLSRLLLEESAGADAIPVYLAVGAISLGIAATIRGILVWLTKRHFWAPSMFLIAAFIAIAAYSVQGSGYESSAATGVSSKASSSE